MGPSRRPWPAAWEAMPTSAASRRTGSIASWLRWSTTDTTSPPPCPCGTSTTGRSPMRWPIRSPPPCTGSGSASRSGGSSPSPATWPPGTRGLPDQTGGQAARSEGPGERPGPDVPSGRGHALLPGSPVRRPLAHGRGCHHAADARVPGGVRRGAGRGLPFRAGRGFAEGRQRHADTWDAVLSPASRAVVDGIDDAEPVLGPESWTRMMYDFLAAARDADDLRPLLDAMVALYFARTATFVRDTEATPTRRPRPGSRTPWIWPWPPSRTSASGGPPRCPPLGNGNTPAVRSIQASN
jgi:hypothetical protein